MNGEPTFTRAPTVLVDVKLDQDEGSRPEVDLLDFELCGELRRLMSRFDSIKKGTVAMPGVSTNHFFSSDGSGMVQS